MNLDATVVRDVIVVIVPMILSLSVHEFAHAWSAYKLGDDTASLEGRMTLNPLVHIDPIGTLFVPIIGILMGGFGLFGWAKPVPVMPHRFRRDVSMRTGMIITALAGPASNVLFAFVVAGPMLAVSKWGGASGKGGELAMTLLTTLFQLNLVLAVFNMIPIYPLDGSRVLPLAWQAKMARFGMLGFVVLILLINAPFFRTLIVLAMQLIGGLIMGFWGMVL